MGTRLLFSVVALGKFTAGLSGFTVSITRGGLIPWDTAPVNLGGYFDTSTGLYTAPVNGIYRSVFEKSVLLLCLSRTRRGSRILVRVAQRSFGPKGP